MTQLVVGLIAFVVAWVLIPFLRKVAIRFQFVDRPNARKKQKEPLPLLGGAAIFAGFVVATLATVSYWGADAQAYRGLIYGSLLLFGIGLVDDYFKTRGQDFPAAPRFVLQIVAAVLVAINGGAVQGFTMPFPEPHFLAFPEWLSYLVTIIWIVGVINVFNFIDGVDGLSGGIAAISAATLAIVALAKGQISSAIWAAALVGSCLGFLRHNFYPARIIMGDAGSTLVGFLLAGISVIGAFKSVTAVSIFVPVMALGLPIFDGLRVVINRMMHGKPPHKPDRTHGHHRLLDAGFSQVQTVTMLYMLSACFSMLSLIVLFAIS
ncbi:MAG TPA: MraY family glycosyltransferase [Bacilli bacterium]|nr:MraY family glycosyltransferase [Bacilli bacterium]